MNWHSILKASVKNAITAIGAAVAPMWISPAQFNLHDWHGLQHVLETIGMAVAVAEVRYWWPKLQDWSNSPDVPEVVSKPVAAQPALRTADPYSKFKE